MLRQALRYQQRFPAKANANAPRLVTRTYRFP